MISTVASRYGGPSVAIRAMGSALAEIGVDVTVATTDADGPLDADIALGVPIVDRGVTYRYFHRTLRGEWMFSLGLTRWAFAHARDFDVVHVHSVFSYATIAGCRAARAAGVPYVLRPLGTLSAWSLAQQSWKKRPYMALIERSHLANAAAIHVTSEAEADDLRALGYESRVRNIPLGVAIGAERGPKPEHGGPLRLLFLSRVHPKKGLPLLFEALARLGREGRAVTLDVVGGGDEAYVRELQARAAAEGVGDRVRFRGELLGEAKAEAFANADVYVLPSSNENFGIAVAEAMAASLPVVISDQVGLASDVVEANAGLVTPLDAGALTAALRTLADDPARRAAMARAARTLAVTRYSWQTTARRLASLYDEVAAGRARGPAHAVH